MTNAQNKIFNSRGFSFQSFARLITIELCLLLVVAATIVLVPRSAKADYPIAIVALQCDGSQNRVLLRFGVLDGKTPSPNSPVALDDMTTYGYGIADIPKSLENKWTNVPYQMEGDCKFNDGHEVSISTFNDPPGEGMNQAVGDSYFTMIIDGHRVYNHRRFYFIFDVPTAGFPISAVEYNGKSLLECKPSEQDQSGKTVSASICYDVSGRLLPGQKYYTPDEQNAWNTQQKMASNLSPFCRKLNFSSIDQVKFGPDINGSSVREADINVLNDAKVYKVFNLGSSDNPEGTNITFLNDNEYTENFMNLVESGGFSSLDDWPPTPIYDQHVFWLQYYDSSWQGQYGTVENELIEFEHKYYVYSKYSDPNFVPSSALSELVPNAPATQPLPPGETWQAYILQAVCTYP